MRPAGSRSLTLTFVAVLGPVFVYVMVNVMVSPTFGVVLLTAFVRARSDCCGVSWCLRRYFP